MEKQHDLLSIESLITEKNNGQEKTRSSVDYSKPFENKYKNLSLPEFQEIAKNADEKKTDEDLEIAIDLLIDLMISINVCSQACTGTEFFVYHASRINYLNKVLEEFSWYKELKHKHSILFFYSNLKAD
jgi:hypothetical protein